MVPTKILFENEIYINKIYWLLEKLEIIPNKLNPYLLAFVHRSLVNEKPDLSSHHNERLEFLWDAVLELTVTKNLFLDYPTKTEWELTDLRSLIVKWKNLALVSRKLEFNKYLILWKWEELSWWRDNDYLLANCVEAFIWAVYLDLWFEEAQKFINDNIYSNLNQILENTQLKDFKSLLQEYTQKEFLITPRYDVLSESWLDHDKIFISWVYLEDKKIWEWKWSSKKKSQEDAARNAYLSYNS